MNILMIAPEPFFQPRGTPISVFLPDDGPGGARPSDRPPHLPPGREPGDREPDDRPGAEPLPVQADQDRPVPGEAAARRPAFRASDRRGPEEALRPPFHPRGGGVFRAHPGAIGPPAPYLRHAFQPAAAARQFPVQQEPAPEAHLRRAGAEGAPPGRRDHRHLQGPPGHGDPGGPGRQSPPHRERPRFPGAWRQAATRPRESAAASRRTGRRSSSTPGISSLTRESGCCSTRSPRSRGARSCSWSAGAARTWKP